MATKKSIAVVVGSIIVDPDVMECRGMDTSAIAGVKMAMESGDKFAPVVLDESTGLLVDGITRLEAFKRLYGVEAKIPVVYVDLPTSTDRLMYSADKNAVNGRRIGDWSLRKYACKLIALGVSHSAIELVLHVPHLTEDMIGGVQVIMQDGTCELRPVKNGPSMPSHVTEAEYRMHALHDRAGQAVVFANQLTRWLVQGWISFDKDSTRIALLRLRDAITAHVPLPSTTKPAAKKPAAKVKTKPVARKAAAKVKAKATPVRKKKP